MWGKARQLGHLMVESKDSVKMEKRSIRSGNLYFTWARRLFQCETRKWADSPEDGKRMGDQPDNLNRDPSPVLFTGEKFMMFLGSQLEASLPFPLSGRSVRAPARRPASCRRGAE